MNQAEYNVVFRMVAIGELTKREREEVGEMRNDQKDDARGSGKDEF